MTLRLYSYWRSSSAWRVRIGLALKGLAYEYRAVNLLAQEQFGAAHRARNPAGQVPVLELEEGGRVIHLAQSMAILELLEERHPAPALLPAEPLERARVRTIAELVNSGIQPLQNAIVLRTLKEKWPGYEREWAARFIARGLDALEPLVAAGAGRFSHGDAPGLADCFVVPQVYNARRYGVDLSPYPALRRVDEACAALPAFQAAHPDRQPDAPPPEGRTP